MALNGFETNSDVGDAPVPVKRVVTKYDREYIKFRWLMAGRDAELKALLNVVNPFFVFVNLIIFCHLFGKVVLRMGFKFQMVENPCSN